MESSTQSPPAVRTSSQSDIPRMQRCSRLIEKLRSYGSRPCIEDGENCYTYDQLIDEFENWGARFDVLAVSPGNVVGIRADYSFSAVAAVLSLLARRALVAMIPRDRDPSRYLADAHATCLLEFDAEGNHEWTHVRGQISHPLVDRLRDSGDGGIIIFTSGTTGRPKAALQSTERFLYKLGNSGGCFRTIAFMLFDHIAGLDTALYTLAEGGTLIITRSRDPEAILRLVESHKADVLPTSPSFLRLLCATDNSTQRDLSSLKVIAYGSEPMDTNTLERVSLRFPNARVSQKYGTTETGTPRASSRSSDSLWLKIKGTDLKVVDDILWIRSEGTILGYLNAPSPIDDQGWYCTGDLVEVDGEWIKVRGRKADVINVGGEKVSPAEVEQTILQLPFVRDTVVAGQAHELMGQIVTARVSLTEAMDPKEATARIRAHCREHLAPHKAPVRIEISAEGFSNARQKAQRKPRTD